MTTPKTPLSREELVDNVVSNCYKCRPCSTPCDRWHEAIEANTRLECQQAFMPHVPNKKQYDKLVDTQMAEISRLQVLAEKQESKFNEMLYEATEIQKQLKNILQDKDKEISKLKEVISKGVDGEVELLKENAQLKELVKEIHKILDDDDGGEWSDNIEEWLAKAEKLMEGK